jgi:hypothetical protein
MKKAAGSPWIRVRDFTETSLWIAATNATTNLPISKDAKIELTEFSAKGMTLKLPPHSCSIGHFLSLKIRKMRHQLSDNNQAKKSQIEEIIVSAKVSEMELISEDIDSENYQWKIITLQFYQFDEDAWKKLIEEYSERQRQLSSLLKNMKE